MLAGMVSYKLITTVYLHKPLLYYQDRIKRIFPLYMLVLLFSYIIYLFGANSYFISDAPSYMEYISNITVIPLSYYMYSGVDKFTLIPPVWSLGVELQFYILAPFLLLRFKNILLFLSLSLSIYILANLGYIDTNYFGYRLIAGVLFIFLIGVLIQKSIQNHKESKYLLIVIYFILLFLSSYIYYIDYKAPYNYETLFALLFGIPFLYLFRSPIPKKIDKYLGEISYAVFLLHFPILWLTELLLDSSSLYLVLFLTIIVSIIFINTNKRLNEYFLK